MVIVEPGKGGHFGAALFSACEAGDVELVARWARRDADGFAKCLEMDGNGALALLGAAQCNHPEFVRFMLQYVDANAASPDGNWPAIEASRRGHLRVLRILLDHGADPNLSDARSNTALVLAAGKGFRDAVLLLLERGARVNLQVYGTPTALSAAALNGHLEIMSDLFAAGGDPNLVSGLGTTSLFAALLGHHPEAAEMLLAFGADVTVADDNALMMAAGEGYAHLVTQFLAKAEASKGEGGEAFVNIPNFYGETALMVACKKRRESVVQALLQDPKLDVDIQDEKYFTALLHAVCAKQAGIAEALLARGASVKPDERANTSVLIQASQRNMPGLVRLILEERGGEEAGVNFRGEYDATALVWACRRSALDIADMLMRAGAAVNTLDAGGFTPLMCALGCDSGSGAETVRLLLERGADPNLHGPMTSPLMLACVRFAPEFNAVRQALIRAGADVNHSVNSNGSTPLQFAIDANNKEAVKTLLNSGARVHADNTQRQLVEYIYELKRDMEALVQVFPHALASSGVSGRMIKSCPMSLEPQ